MANRFLSNIKINDAYTFPASDGANGQAIITDGAGNLSFGDVASGGANSASVIYRDNFVGDGVETEFYLERSLSSEDQSQVFINGVYQQKDTYTVVDNLLTLSTAPASGYTIEVMSITGINTGPTTLYQDNFTGNGSSTTFTLANSVNDEIKTMVFLNGVYQFKGTYSVSGTSLIFDAAPANGVAIEVITIATASSENSAQKVLFYGKATGAISKGDAVMFAGAQGDHFLIAKATQAQLATNHEYILGLANQDFAVNEYGYVVEFGRVDAIDTSMYTAGDILWFDSEGTTAGAITNTQPTPPNTKIQLAAVIRSHANEGVLFVRPTVYHELSELHDVSITNIADKDLLSWNNTLSVWENTKTLGNITTGNITTSGTIDGVDVSSFKSDYDAHNHDSRYYTNLEIDGFLANTNNWNTAYSYSQVGHLPLTGGTLTGALSGTSASFNSSLEIRTSTYNRISSYFSGDYTSGFKFSDLNGGIYYDAAADYLNVFTDYLNGKIAFSTAGSERVRITNTGNVGIGTTSPQSYGGYTTLHIGSASSRGLIKLGTAVSLNGPEIFTNPSNDLIINTNDTDTRINILGSNGYVGIGNTNPSYRLTVGGDSDTRIQIDSTTTQGIFFTKSGVNNGTFRVNGSGDYEFYTNNVSQAVVIKSGGNVGIGNTNPDYKLDVSGTIATNSLYTFSSSWTTGTANKIRGYFGNDDKSIQFLYDNSPAGLLLKENNSFLLSVNGGNTIFANSSGQVGIGTTSPEATLDVVSNSGGIGVAIRTRPANDWGWLIYDSNDSSERLAEIGVNRIGVSSADLYFTTSGSTKMIIKSGGNVGIGTTSPSDILHVRKSSSSNIDMYLDNPNTTGGNSARLIFRTTDSTGNTALNAGGIKAVWNNRATNYVTSDIIIDTRGTDNALVVKNNGYVGIGTTQPETSFVTYVGGVSNMVGMYLDTDGTGGSVGIGLGSAVGPYLVGNTKSDNTVRGAYGGSRIGFNAGGFTFDYSSETSGTRSWTNYMAIDTSGRVIKPYQVYFAVKTNSNFSITSTDTIIVFATVNENTGSGYNSSNGRFTAPINGRYLFTFTASVSSGAGDFEYNAVYILYNGGGTHYRFRIPGNLPSGKWAGYSGSAILNMAAGDYVQLSSYTSAGTITLVSSEAIFSGYLLG